jgi:hypothetical protein
MLRIMNKIISDNTDITSTSIYRLYDRASSPNFNEEKVFVEYCTHEGLISARTYLIGTVKNIDINAAMKFVLDKIRDRVTIIENKDYLLDSVIVATGVAEAYIQEWDMLINSCKQDVENYICLLNQQKLKLFFIDYIEETGDIVGHLVSREEEFYELFENYESSKREVI